MAAPVIDNAAAGPGSTGSTSFSWSQTVGSVANRILLIGVMNVAAPSGSQVNTVTSALSGALTQIPGWLIQGTVFNQIWLQVFYLLNPVSGSDTLTVDFGTNTPGDACGCSASYSGVDQVNPFGTLATNTGGVGSSTSSVVASSAVGELVFSCAFMFSSGATDMTPTSGVNERCEGHSNLDNSYRLALGDADGASTVTMGWSIDGSSLQWQIGAIALKPVSSPFTPASVVGPFPTYRPDLP
jgi:hypothetical protein